MSETTKPKNKYEKKHEREQLTKILQERWKEKPGDVIKQMSLLATATEITELIMLHSEKLSYEDQELLVNTVEKLVKDPKRMRKLNIC